jgi:hypothetical protein
MHIKLLNILNKSNNPSLFQIILKTSKRNCFIFFCIFAKISRFNEGVFEFEPSPNVNISGPCQGNQ